MKKIISIITLTIYSQLSLGLPHTFSEGESISRTKLDENVREIENYANKIGLTVHLNDYLDDRIIDRDIINSDISKINSIKSDSRLSPIPEGIVRSSEVNLKLQVMMEMIEKMTGVSCLNLLQNRPELINQDGIYKLHPEGSEPFDAYCDMTTSGGGWTLLFSPDSTTGYTSTIVYNSSHPAYKGNDNRSITKNILGSSMTLVEQQKSVKFVKFTQININGFGATSSTSSTFSEKHSSLTPWNFSSPISGLGVCGSYSGWNANRAGAHIRSRAVLGCVRPISGGDYPINGLGVRSDKLSTYSCGRNGQGGNSHHETAHFLYNCGYSYLIARTDHRGGTVYSSTNSKNNMIWGR